MARQPVFKPIDVEIIRKTVVVKKALEVVRIVQEILWQNVINCCFYETKWLLAKPASLAVVFPHGKALWVGEPSLACHAHRFLPSA